MQIKRQCVSFSSTRTSISKLLTRNFLFSSTHVDFDYWRVCFLLFCSLYHNSVLTTKKKTTPTKWFDEGQAPFCCEGSRWHGFVLKRNWFVEMNKALIEFNSTSAVSSPSAEKRKMQHLRSSRSIVGEDRSSGGFYCRLSHRSRWTKQNKKTFRFRPTNFFWWLRKETDLFSFNRPWQ